ncbi:HYC_CC_PP family protein [Flavobacterium lacustre]|uniref:HYC_CC_PP family protein n=1 Tax=Flavobacterium lacustre TaxID=3016339 RepID=UPI0022B5ECD3|nr:hypothetical protein [Flavobacterium lacustre]
MNIKKCTSLFLAFLLLVSNVGMAFNVHYCAGEIASVSLESQQQIKEKGCCEKIVSKKDSCCKDKVFHFEKKSDNAIVKIFFFELNAPFLIQEWQPVIFSLTANFKITPVATYYCDANAPPLFKLYSQYIFYA